MTNAAQRTGSQRGAWLVAILVVVTSLAAPTFLPTSIKIGSSTVFLYEPVLLIATVWAVRAAGIPSTQRLRIFAGVAMLAIGLVGATVSGNMWGYVLADSRGPIVVVLATVFGIALARTDHLDLALRAVKWTLWLSLVFAGLSLATGLQLRGRTESAALYLDGVEQQTSGVRLLLPTTSLALAVLCAIITLVVAQRINLRDAWPYLLPALALVFLSFSRNSLIAIAVALAFGVVVRPTAGAVMGVVGRGLAAAGLTAAAWALISVSPDNPLAGWLSGQFDAYSGRVLSIFDPATLAVDPSTQYRQVEISHLTTQFANSPIFGHGFGFQYQAPTGAAGSFFATDGTYYSHNFYWWLAVKVGLVGVLLFAGFVIPPLFSRIRSASSPRVGAATGALALLAISFVAPMPLGTDSGSTVVLGTLLGIAAGLMPARAVQVAPESLLPARRLAARVED